MCAPSRYRSSGASVREGCPLSPLLFPSDLEAELDGSRTGFDWTCMEVERTIPQRLPVLMYTNDIALTADSRSDLQQLLNIRTKHTELLGLRFGTPKSEKLHWGNLGAGRSQCRGSLLQQRISTWLWT